MTIIGQSRLRILFLFCFVPSFWVSIPGPAPIPTKASPLMFSNVAAENVTPKSKSNSLKKDDNEQCISALRRVEGLSLCTLCHLRPNTRRLVFSRCFLKQASRERSKSAPYLRLKNSKRTSKYSLLQYPHEEKIEKKLSKLYIFFQFFGVR